MNSSRQRAEGPEGGCFLEKRNIGFDLDPWIAVLPWPFSYLPSSVLARLGNFFLTRWLSPLIISLCGVREESLKILQFHRAAGDKIFCITNRPLYCRRATINWLIINHIPHDDLVFVKGSKAKVITGYKIEQYYDSNPKNALGLDVKTVPHP